MLQRESTLDPGVKHPGGKYIVGRSAVAQRPPGAEAMVLPETIDDDGIVAGPVLTQPGDERGGEGVRTAGRAERVHRQGEVVDFGVRGIVERRDFDGVAVALVRGGE